MAEESLPREPTVTYRLPGDGREVEVAYSVSLNRFEVSYSLDGRVVRATIAKALLLPCSCGKPVTLRALRIRVNRKNGVTHWIEHESGGDACPGPQGAWRTAVLKPYPREETERPGSALMIRWNDWRLLMRSGDAQGAWQCEGCGAWVEPDPSTPEGRGHQVPNEDGSPGYCGPVSWRTPVQEVDRG